MSSEGNIKKWVRKYDKVIEIQEVYVENVSSETYNKIWMSQENFVQICM